jgi:hypothetical protein
MPPPSARGLVFAAAFTLLGLIVVAAAFALR